MMRINLKIALSIFLALAVSRFIPHPPNFTSLIALSFYVPAIFGSRYMPVVLLSFVFTDMVIGFHNTLLFTWGSVIFIGIFSRYFTKSILTRISGALTGALIFFIITNFGVWVSGMYQANLNGLIESYVMGLPFFGYSLVSTFIFGSLIETVYKFTKFSLKKI
ncbi:hypothetical protein OAZ96_01430 [Pelagibacteraceae bacterium]|nr:hypothetical protein [Pelagibacteraceae bacterium]